MKKPEGLKVAYDLISQADIVLMNMRPQAAKKLGLREEGVAFRYLEINGVWEDHVRYAITSEEWSDRRGDLVATWISRA